MCVSLSLSVSLLALRLSEELQSLPSRTYALRNPPPRTEFGPDFDLILTRFGPEKAALGPNRVKIRSKLGQNQVKIGSSSVPGEGFGGGRGQRGRSGWEGSVAPPESLDLSS